MTRSRKISVSCVGSSVSHSQITTGVHPSSASAACFRASLATFSANLFSQKGTRDFGV